MMKYIIIVTCLWHCSLAYVPEVNHGAIAGLWKLTQKLGIPKTADQFPMKEFTVFPKDARKQERSSTNEQEMLLMLHEDGHFVQYEEDEINIPDKLKYHDDAEAVLNKFFGKIKGKWDFVDGHLILAADRPTTGKVDPNPDTILVGRVEAHSEESLVDNPVLSQAVEDSESRKVDSFDTHLSVPKGQVEVGRFTYPMSHPYFFDQPMFQPMPKGRFQLRQVLGALNAKSVEDEDLVERFKEKDFYGKSFFLSSHPIALKRPKGNTRWSIKYNRYVEDPPTKEAKKQAEEAENRPVNIRVLEVAFFANNTFATVSGLGDNILRGKFHIVGEKRDHLWMQVWRFGFGRSVSGSVYSEGKSLTKEDEKTYWGEISYEDSEEEGEAAPNGDNGSSLSRLIVRGSVIYGYGLEPQPVGRFIMTERSDSHDDDGEEEDDDSSDGFEWSNAFQ